MVLYRLMGCFAPTRRVVERGALPVGGRALTWDMAPRGQQPAECAAVVRVRISPEEALRLLPYEIGSSGETVSVDREELEHSSREWEGRLPDGAGRAGQGGEAGTRVLFLLLPK